MISEVEVIERTAQPYVGIKAHGLVGPTAFLLKWAEEHNLTWDVTQTPEGERWGARLEIYETDPATEPDLNKWTTQLAFRLLG